MGTRKKLPKIVLYALGAAMLLCVCLVANVSNDPEVAIGPPTAIPSPTAIKFNESMAIIKCRRFVKERLKVPDSAEFSNEKGYRRKDKPVNFAAVTGIVKSQNVFGVMLSSGYRCDVHYIPYNSTQWILDDLSLYD